MQFFSIILPISFALFFQSSFSHFPPKEEWFQTMFQSCVDQSNANVQSWSYLRDNIAVYAMKGKKEKNDMQDRFSIVDNQANGDQRIRAFAIYDGHMREAVAADAEQNLLPSIIQSISDNPSKDISQTIKDVILQYDQNVMEISRDNRDAGSTALIGLSYNNKLYIANVGDCRAVGLTDSNGCSLRQLWGPKGPKTKQMTTDHKATNKKECKRVKKNGGTIEMVQGIKRVNGQLMVTRALGDASMKNSGITAVPDIKVIDLQKSPLQYLIMASDGFWDEFKNEDATKFVSSHIDTERLFGAKQLVEEAVVRGSRDDITVMIIKF